MQKKATLNVPVALTVSTAPSSPSVSRAGQGTLMNQMSKQYANLNADQKALWNLANNHVQSPTDPENNTKRGTNGWTLYFGCSAALLDSEQSLTKTPAPIAIPENLPPMRAETSYIGNDPTIKLIPNTPYAAGPTIVVWATPIVPLGNGSTTRFSGKAYRKIGTLTNGIPANGVDVGTMYLSVFPSVARSCKIGFKLQAVNPGGYHSSKLFVVGFTPLLTLADFGLTATDDDFDIAVGQ